MTDNLPAPTTPSAPNSREISLEAQLRFVTEELYKRGVELAAKNKMQQDILEELHRQSAKISELDKLKSELLWITANRLRGPLSAISASISVVADGDYGDIPTKAKDMLNKAVLSCKDMNTIFTEFTRATEISSDLIRYSMVPVDIRGLVQEVILDAKALAVEKGIEIHKHIDEGELNASVDIERMKMAFAVLVDNSLRYTPKGGSVHVYLTRSTLNAAEAILEVRDSGIGITEQTLKTLFTRFVRGEEANKIWVNGSGLGLFIARSIVVAHKGIIDAKSEGIDKGASFTVRLPLIA